MTPHELGPEAQRWIAAAELFAALAQCCPEARVPALRCIADLIHSLGEVMLERLDEIPVDTPSEREALAEALRLIAQQRGGSGGEQ